MTTPPSSETVALTPVVEGCIEACRRCEALVQAVAPAGSPDRERAYRKIGRHMRHCLDHFSCLIQSLETGVVDYDARAREERLEQDPHYFLDRLSTVIGKLRAIRPTDCRRVIGVRQEADSCGGSVEVQSNLERELVFLSGHTIHHIAIMTLLAEAEGIRVPEKLDMAFSTASHLHGKEQPAGG